MGPFSTRNILSVIGGTILIVRTLHSSTQLTLPLVSLASLYTSTNMKENDTYTLEVRPYNIRIVGYLILEAARLLSRNPVKQQPIQ